MKKGELQRAWQIRVELEEVWPPVWRRILVSDRINLLELHEVIQEVFGWEDYHLHSFKIHGVEYGDPEHDDFDIHDETETSLRALGLTPGESFTYTYDFGDGWTHTLRLERILPVQDRKRLPRCLAGGRACPPEDVGGTGGYAEFLEALSDPEHPEHDRYLEWVGGAFDPEAFDPKDANRRLADRAAARRAPLWGRVPDRYRNAPLYDPSVWGTAATAEHTATARDLPLRRDMLALLGYLRDHKVTGTSSKGNLPLKVVAEVAAAFVDPPAMEMRLGSSVFPARSEKEVWPVHFAHILANGANLVSGGPGRHWRLTQRGEQYFSAPADAQVWVLLSAWWYEVDWTVALHYNIFGDTLPSQVPRSALTLLKELGVGKREQLEPFVDRLIEEVGWRWDTEQSDRIREHMELRAFNLTSFGRLLVDRLR
ncbi:MAG: plasmid pRiA4b ORF-3 family protein [Spirochaetia bacterium]